MVALNFERAGDGPPLLHLGGTGGDLRRPRNALDRALQARFTVLRVDQRGMGLSPVPPGPWCMADFARDALELLDRQGWERCAVLGYSFGGMVAQELALAAPPRIATLVLLSTTSGGAGGSSFPLHEWLHLPLHAQAQRMVLQSDLRRDDAWCAANAQLYEAMVADTEAGFSLAESTPEGARGRRLQLEARRGHDTWARLPSLQVPTQVLAGRHDGIAPLAAQERLAQRIPDAGVTVFEGGHLFFLQDADALPAIVAALDAG
jgi:3-oxoadipate enol-lactonase